MYIFSEENSSKKDIIANSKRLEQRGELCKCNDKSLIWILGQRLGYGQPRIRKHFVCITWEEVGIAWEEDIGSIALNVVSRRTVNSNTPVASSSRATTTTTITMQVDTDRHQLGQLMDPSTPAGKFLRDLGITMDDARQLGIASLSQDLPRKERTKYGKRKKLSNAEKKVLTKERNREHARSTRTRKKMILDALESRLAEINMDSSLTTTTTPKLNPILDRNLQNKRLCCVRHLLSLCSNATGTRHHSSSSDSSINMLDYHNRPYNECNDTLSKWAKCIAIQGDGDPFRITFPALPQQLINNSADILEGLGAQGAINACSVIGEAFTDILAHAKSLVQQKNDCTYNMPVGDGGANCEDKASVAGDCSIRFVAVPGSDLRARDRGMLHIRVELELCLASSVTPSIASVLGMARSVFVPGVEYLSEFHIKWDMIAFCSQIVNLLPKQQACSRHCWDNNFYVRTSC